jgi:general secretion pathway protein G
MRKTSRLSRRRKAFTLLEVLMVIVILGILAAVIAPTFFGTQVNAERDLAQLVIDNGFNNALDRYRLDMGTYPETLEELLVRPDDEELAKEWAGPYIKEGDLIDPWKSEWYYQFPGEENTDSYDLGSNGPNRSWGDEDDLKNWKE